LNPSEKYKSVGRIIPNISYGKIKNVPNHQPAYNKYPQFPQKWVEIGPKIEVDGIGFTTGG
jgi:hypothetical protein